MNNFSFTTCRSLVNELGGIQHIADLCRQQGITRPLIVTDPGIQQLGLLQRLETLLSQANMPFSSFAEVVADPPEAIIYAGLSQAKDFAADGIIGFGGGSSMDTAKLVALLARSGQSLTEIYGVNQAQGQRLPLILIPTTAGTGSEVTAVAIVTTGSTSKMGVVAPQLFPDVALLDAELTVGLPSAITAMTGIDAMVHAIEAYTSIHRKNPYSDMLARETLGLMAGHLRRACQQGDDLDARQAMLFGACLAGQAFANAPVAAVHALAYPLGGNYHLPHGLSNSLMLPHVLRFNNANAQANHWYSELASLITGTHCKADGGLVLAAYFDELTAALGLSQRLRDCAIAEADLPLLASDALQQQRLLVNNPRTVSEADALALYRAAY
ncbi:iron-containing alcohol dehydrogenase [Spongiibacter sp. KMU-166]|uniref:Iron-containing alcohol dehydrogenase n=1 Tax=Spongiibacter thalassae TaxID=2721624 RepID=A0ABX1GH22_9GAMM|nr:iron-containing alcohol dehydrogenase [Spongiibacter thalassae]NKI18515.1 iron-containing alcohol dehydrogenase [Spongiibacter thalassae]